MSHIFWITLVITARVVAATSSSDIFTLSRLIPQYVQANLTFARAKQYFQDNLPYGNGAYVTNANREFANLCGITGRLVQDSIINNKEYYYSPAVIQEYALYARENYEEVVRSTHELFNEASEKILPIINLIRSECSPDFFPDCNERVDARVLDNPFVYHMPAKLHIHLGKVSRNIMRNQVLIEKLISNNEVVQYFSLRAGDASIGKIIKKLARSYTILKMMGTIYQ